MKADALQSDLFDRAPRYPYAAATRRGSDTSAAAAPAQSRVSELHVKILSLLMAHPATPDEIADVLKESVLTIRPRCAELKRQGRIKDSGNRRKNQSGKSAAVLELV